MINEILSIGCSDGDRFVEMPIGWSFCGDGGGCCEEEEREEEG